MLRVDQLEVCWVHPVLLHNNDDDDDNNNNNKQTGRETDSKHQENTW
jgi:hypothetical protein